MGEAEGESGGLEDLFGTDFVKVQKVARGGSGTIYRAEHRRLKRPVILKLLDVVELDSTGTPSAEAKVQASVSWHSNVLTVLDEAHTPHGRSFLVLEDAEGGSLSGRLAVHGSLGVPEVLEMASQVAAALAAAHGCQVVHCDVKPSNVLFARDGSVRLSDFGSASSSTTSTIELLQGSLPFAPPELLEGRRPGTANDVYGLGVTAYTAITGSPPFGDIDQPAAATIARIHCEELDFGGLGLPDPVVDLLTRCTAKDPAARPSIHEVTVGLSSPASQANGAASQAQRTREIVEVVEASLAGRRAVIEDLHAMLASDSSAVDLVRALVFDVPRRSAEAVMPVVELASRLSPTLGGRTISLDEGARLVTAEVLNSMCGGPQIVYFGVGEYEEPSGPASLRQAARDLGQALLWAKVETPGVSWDMGPGYEERIWSLLGKFSSPSFVAEFLEDPRSFDLFDPETLSLAFEVALPLFEAWIALDHPYVTELIDRRPDLRKMLMYEYPAVIIQVLAGSNRQSFEIPEEWILELEVGLIRLPSWERASFRQRFAEQLDTIGIDL